jgi:hypothetical protein
MVRVHPAFRIQIRIKRIKLGTGQMAHKGSNWGQVKWLTKDSNLGTGKWFAFLLDRGELHLVRNQLPPVQATQRASQPAEIPLPPKKQTAKDQRRRAIDGSSS